MVITYTFNLTLFHPIIKSCLWLGLKLYHYLYFSLSLFLSISLLSPLSCILFRPIVSKTRCLDWYQGILPKSELWKCKQNMFLPIAPNETYLSFVQKAYRGVGMPSPHQGWFLANLFFYSMVRK